MRQHHLLLLLGGHYHDFGGFEAFIRALLKPHGFEVTASCDSADRLDPEDVEVVLLYTCDVEPPEHAEEGLTYTAGISKEETRSLVRWVGAGGGLVAAHSATTIRPQDDELRHLLGGRFLSHPPRFPFTVYPMQRQHPVLRGVGAFTIVDELYTQDYRDVDVHAVAIDRGSAYPMVWTRSEGAGRVVHVAPGHDASVWASSAYRTLMRQAVDWSMGSRRVEP